VSAAGVTDIDATGVGLGADGSLPPLHPTNRTRATLYFQRASELDRMSLDTRATRAAAIEIDSRLFTGSRSAAAVEHDPL